MVPELADRVPNIFRNKFAQLFLGTTLGSTVAAIGYEYNKVRPQSGSTNLGQGVVFSIPQFGDFFHDMVVRTRLTSFQSSVLMTPIQGAPSAAGQFTLFPPNGMNADGTFGPDAAGYPGTTDGTNRGSPLKFYNLVDAFGNRLVQGQSPVVPIEGPVTFDPHDPVPYRNLVRYCEYPGNRLFQDVKFDVNGNPLDEYDDIVPVFLTKFCLAPNKVSGFKRLVGQEVPLEGYGTLRTSPVTDLDALNTPPNINLAHQGHGFGLFNNPPPGAFGNGQGAGSAAPDYLAGISPFPPGISGPPFTAAPHYWADNWPSVGGQLALPWGGSFGAGGLPPTSPPAGPGAITGSAPLAQPGASHPLPPFGNFQAANGVGPIPFAPLNSNPYPVVDVSRELKAVVDGPQTPKPAQPPLEIWNKLRFWFNDDVRLSIASVSIPFGQRFITIELAEHHHLAFEFPNLYLETIIEVQPVPTVTLGDGLNVSQRIVNYQPIFQVGHPDGPNIDRMELYVNNIFVNPEVHDIFIKRIGFSLIRVYREQVTRITQDGAGEMLLSQLKWPVEYMFVGMRPAWNVRHVTAGAGGIVAGGNPNVWRDWHRMTKMVDADVDVRQRAQIGLPACLNAGGLVGGVLPSIDPGATSNLGQVVHDTYAIPVPTVDSLTLTAHGITIFDDFRDIFFNSYMPFHFGGPALNTPDDPGALFVNFALFPRSYQPSGHLNISRARETYIKWTTSYISPKTPKRLGVSVPKAQASVHMTIIFLSVMWMRHRQIAGKS